MKSRGRLTGQEAEEWVKEFAKRTFILVANQYPLEKFVHLLESKLPHRFRNGRLFMYKDIPEGNDWIDNVLSGKTIESIGDNNRRDLSDYLIDKVVATDLIVELRDNHQTINRIAIDVTINPGKEKEKLDRVRGKPEKDDPLGYNQNQNLPSVRKQLGIDRHLVLTLSDERQKLPSHEYLLTELFAFVNSRSQTKALNLTDVPELHRFKGNEIEQIEPKQMWDRFGKGIHENNAVEFSKQVTLKAIRAGNNQEAVYEMLNHDPQCRQATRSSLAKGENYKALVYGRAMEAIELQTHKAPTQQAMNFRGLKAARVIVERVGKDAPEGGRIYSLSDRLVMTQRGKDFKIEVANERGTILEMKDGIFKGSMTIEDCQTFEKAIESIQANQQQGIDIRKSRESDFEPD
ncbi:MAG: hypothetical protein KME35_24365 [Aphanocapsa sp. GSE-SYN-MK-11-07L]|jgi:hypothetical protein|nr:hypothetical protein [Aphanocapsa sp. GSE-SYN-MK-11-07L]